MKTCVKCGVSKDGSEFYRHKLTADGLGSWCKQCLSDRYKERHAQADPALRASGRKAIEKYRKENPKINRAHQIARNARRNGELIPQPCEVCGDLEVDGHHDDYNFPLIVRWLCCKCHKDWHSKNEPIY